MLVLRFVAVLRIDNAQADGCRQAVCVLAL
jgi:hypothetical protein